MKIKLSKYNLLINRNETENILFNTFTNGLAIINETEKELELKIHRYNNENISREESEEIESMISNGFVIDSDLDEDKILKLLENKKKYGCKGLGITILPTMNCNMECFYCFEEKYRTAMTKEVADNLIRFVKQDLINNKYDSLSVNWFGGEPLLEVDMIKYISNQLIEFCEANKITYNSDIVTNGTLLNDVIMEELANECKLDHAQITLDGIGEINNRRRKLKNNKESYDLIVNNIDKLRKFMKVSVRMNIDKDNLVEIENMLDLVKQKQWDKDKNVSFRLSPVINSNNDCSMKKSCLTTKEFFEIDIEKCSKLNDIERYPKYRALSCGATGMSCYAIDPDGFIYKCLQQPNKNHYNAIGNVASRIEYNTEMLKWITSDHKAECIECKLFPICKGGCPYHAMKGDQFDCEAYKIYTEEKIKIFADNFTKVS